MRGERTRSSLGPSMVHRTRICLNHESFLSVLPPPPPPRLRLNSQTYRSQQGDDAAGEEQSTQDAPTAKHRGGAFCDEGGLNLANDNGLLERAWAFEVEMANRTRGRSCTGTRAGTCVETGRRGEGECMCLFKTKASDKNQLVASLIRFLSLRQSRGRAGI